MEGVGTLQLPKVFPFQASVETIRAHHWRHFTDVYLGCSFNCQYCLYKGPGDYGAHVHAVDQVASVGDTSSQIGILDIGATTDPYQHIERQERRTRLLLETLEAAEVPTFVLTRGSLVIRDLDLLVSMSSRGLVEVCFSVISLREEVAAALEPGAPSVADRLDCARQLADVGVPISFHVAPLIPGLDSVADRARLASELVAAGASHIFMAMLGARGGFWDSFLTALRSDASVMNDWSAFESSYDTVELAAGAATTCDADVSARTMEPIIEVARAANVVAVSENLPFLTTGSLEGGIYRSKLPTVYDMCEWIGRCGRPVSWEEFASEYYGSFAPSGQLLALTRALWRSGELFDGSRVSLADSAEGTFVYGDTMSVPSVKTLVARRTSQ